ncbi:MAG: HAD-IA family hydrolase [Vulcanimicrobiota bacterium]
MLSSLAIFDLDGVLIDSAEANVQAFRYGMEQVGVVVTDRESILDLVGLPALTMLAKLGCPDTEVEVVFQQYVKPFYLENLPTLARAYPGSRQVLEQLLESGFRIGACTSGDRTTQRAALEAIGLWDLIEIMQTPDDSDFGKPDARYLQELLEKFGPHGDLHHIEDSEVGMVMGHALGATTYYASYGNGKLSGTIEPHVTLTAIEELPGAILRTCAS